MNIRQLHQLEITSRCNLRCRYCVSPNLQRPKVDMDEATFRLGLSWVRKFVDRGWQHDVNLAGIGESTIHPEFVRYVHLAREIVGWQCQLVFATNGVAMTDEMARAIAPASPRVFVSLHRPEKAGPAVEMLRRVGILSGVSLDPSVSAIDWAGQVKWHVSVPQRRECAWLSGGMVMLMADGRITRCPLDGSGIGVICTINDDLDAHRTSPYDLCAKCDQLVPAKMREVA